ncbi:hypothetical protein Zmor_003874 [Zophobas morio]|uniref:H15 domain-containing protein n=1 Tax=Zophobas morio TaxID=2755281 RepID=A0AA38HJ70_9CUCU|nr:hypothetical protein Zmor_003874 [Zophobas morio]
MADVENQTASSVTTGSAATPQSHAKKEKKAKNPRAKPSHPPTSEMVNNAIKGLKERGGSSLQAIKKFVAANYKVDAEKVRARRVRSSSPRPPPVRRRLLPKRRAPPLPPPPQRKPRNRPPPRQKRKLEPPRNPDRLPKRRNLTRLVRLKNPKHPNPRQPKPFLSR